MFMSLETSFPNSWVNKIQSIKINTIQVNKIYFYIFTVLWKYRVNEQVITFMLFLIKNEKDIYLFSLFLDIILKWYIKNQHNY